MGEHWAVWISVLRFLFPCLTYVQPWFIVVLGWLGEWKKLLANTFSRSWKFLCYASSYVTQPIRWRFAVLQKEKTCQESWRWSENLWRHRYAFLLPGIQGICIPSCHILAFLIPSENHHLNCQGTIMSWPNWIPETFGYLFFFLNQWHGYERHGRKMIVPTLDGNIDKQ